MNRSRIPPFSRELIVAAATFAAAAVLLPRQSQAQDVPPASAPAAPTTEPTTGPTTEPVPAETLQVVIAEVRGLVRARTAPDQPWQKAAVGMQLGPGAEFQTGPKSACVLTIESNQTIVLDRLGVVSVDEAVRRGDEVKTDLIMKYGRTEYEIEAAGAKHDATIRSPSSTLAVRGTRVNLYDQPPFVPSAESYTGRAIYQYAKRQTAIGGPGRGANIRADRGSAAESALGETVVDPSIAEARTRSDAKLIETETSRGALAEFDERTGITVIKGGAGRPTDDQVAGLLPGRFNVIARWSGNQNLDLILDTQFFPADQVLANIGFFAASGVDEIIFPGFGQNVTATGGRTDFDHRGGPNGGYEVAYYDRVQSGIYGIIVLPGGRGGGTEPATVTIESFLDGQPIDMIFPQLDEQGNLILDEFGLPLLDIAPIIERVVTTTEQNVAGFTLVPSLEELLANQPPLPPEEPPPDEGGGEVETASNKPASANNRAARRAAQQAARVEKAAEKQQLVTQRLADRQQKRLAREMSRSQQVDRKLGLSADLNGKMGPHPLPKK